MSEPKYKVGNKIKIKTLKQMIHEYGGRDFSPRVAFGYNVDMESIAENNNRIFTIMRIVPRIDDPQRHEYYIEEGGFTWSEEMIEGIAELTDEEISKEVDKLDFLS